MATDFKKVLRDEHINRADLQNALLSRQLGVSSVDKVIGYKDSGGVMSYYTPEGGNATFNSLRITGLDEAGFLFVDGNGNVSVASVPGTGDLGIWNYSSALTNDPTEGQWRLNNSDPALATEFYINERDTTGTLWNSVLEVLDAGGSVLLQDIGDSAKFIVLNIASDGILSGGVYTFQVTLFLEGSTPFVDGDTCATTFSQAQNLGVVNWIDFNPSLDPNPDYNEGRLFYNAGEKTMQVYTDNPDFIQAMGQTQVARGKNETGVAIAKGTVVDFNGIESLGAGLTITVADATDDSNRRDKGWALAVATENIPDGEYGTCAFFGTIVNMDTSGLIAGEPAYLGSNGSITNDRPDYPAESVLVGSAIVIDATNGVFAAFTERDTYDYEFDGTILERHNTNIVTDGVTVWLDVSNLTDPTRDTPIQLGGNILQLNTTTGSGAAGAARIELLQGTSEVPQYQVVYVTDVGGVATLQVSAGYPVPPFAPVATIAIQDAATVQTEGAITHRRTTSAKAYNSRGLISYMIERFAIMYPEWRSGVTPTATIDAVPSPDLLDLSVIAGVVYQMNKQDFPALQVSTDGIYVANGPGGAGLANYGKYLNLTELCGHTSFSTVRNTNCRGHLVIWGAINKDTNECKLFCNLPTDLYGGSDSNAYLDPNNTADYSVNEENRVVAFLIAQIQYDLSAGGETVLFLDPDGTTTTSGEFIRVLLGTPIAVGGGSSGGGTFIPNLTQVLTQGNDAGGQQIKNLQDATDPQDAVTLSQLNATSGLWEENPSGVLKPVDDYPKTRIGTGSTTLDGKFEVNVAGATPTNNITITGSNVAGVNGTYTYTSPTRYTHTGGTWYLEDTNWYWNITNNLSNAWDGTVHYGAGGRPTPADTDAYTNYQSGTGTVFASEASAGGETGDAITTNGIIHGEGNIISDKGLQIKAGTGELVIGQDVTGVYGIGVIDSPTSVLFDIGDIATALASFELYDNGALKLPLCSTADILTSLDNVVTYRFLEEQNYLNDNGADQARVSYFSGDDRTYYSTNANILQLGGEVIDHIEICDGSAANTTVHVGGEFDDTGAIKIVVDNTADTITAQNLTTTNINNGGNTSLVTKEWVESVTGIGGQPNAIITIDDLGDELQETDAKIVESTVSSTNYTDIKSSANSLRLIDGQNPGTNNITLGLNDTGDGSKTKTVKVNSDKSMALDFGNLSVGGDYDFTIESRKGAHLVINNDKLTMVAPQLTESCIIEGGDFSLVTKKYVEDNAGRASEGPATYLNMSDGNGGWDPTNMYYSSSSLYVENPAQALDFVAVTPDWLRFSNVGSSMDITHDVTTDPGNPQMTLTDLGGTYTPISDDSLVTKHYVDAQTDLQAVTDRGNTSTNDIIVNDAAFQVNRTADGRRVDIIAGTYENMIRSYIPGGGSDWTTLGFGIENSGGSSEAGSVLWLTDPVIKAPRCETTDLDAEPSTSKALITKEYAEANYGGGGGSVGTADTMNASDGSGGWSETDVDYTEVDLTNQYRGFKVEGNYEFYIGSNESVEIDIDKNDNANFGDFRVRGYNGKIVLQATNMNSAVTAPSTDNNLIELAGDKALITKEYGDEKYGTMYQFGWSSSGKYVGTSIVYVPGAAMTDLTYSGFTGTNKYGLTMMEDGNLIKFTYHFNQTATTISEPVTIRFYRDGVEAYQTTISGGSNRSGIHTVSGTEAVLAGEELSFSIVSTATGVTIDGCSIIAKVV